MRRNWLSHSRLALLAGLLVTTASVARAQTPMAGVGARIESVPEAGITAITTPIVAEMRRGIARDVARLGGRRSDSVLNGALIGAGAAVAGGLFLCTRTEPWRNCRDDVGPMLRIGAVGAGIGIAIDALIRRRDPGDPGSATSRVFIAPVVARRGAGVAVQLTRR